MPITGNTITDPVDVPQSSVIVPGNPTPVLLEGSTNVSTDNNSNTTTAVNINIKEIGRALLVLGQALKAASIPVVLASDQTIPVSLASLPTLPSGTNVIGHVIVDSIGSVTISTLPSLPAGTNVIGHIIVDSGTITANAGTNLNTSLLALETGGNLASLVANTADLLADGDNLATINTNTANIPAKGQTTKANSMPVTLASDSTEPVNVGTPTASSVSVGTSSTAVVTPGANAKFLLLTNDSANTIYLNISGGAAALNAGVRLNANGGSILFDRYIPSAAITAISSIASSNLLVEVG